MQMGVGNIKGYSLVELMIVLLLVGLALAAGMSIMQTGNIAWQSTDSKVQLYDNVRKVLQKVVRELEQTGLDKDGVVQLTITDNGGFNNTDVIRFSIPVTCHEGDSLIDANGDVAHWGAPITWGCSEASCMDADDDCSTVDYRYIEYRVVSGNKLVRRVLDNDDPPVTVREDVISDGIANFQVDGCFTDINVIKDLAMATGGTTLTSSSGGFSANMVGRYIRITSGTNFFTGLYKIEGYTDTNTVIIDRDATIGGNASDGIGRIAAESCREDVSVVSNLDLVDIGGKYTLISSGGEFTSTMMTIGTDIEITGGTNFVKGDYEIVEYQDANNVVLDRNAATGVTSSDGIGHVGGQERGLGLLTVSITGQNTNDPSLNEVLSSKVYMRNYLKGF